MSEGLELATCVPPNNAETLQNALRYSGAELAFCVCMSVSNGQSRRKRRSAIAVMFPWLITLVVIAAAGAGAFYGVQKYGLIKAELTDTNSELQAVQARIADAEERAMTATAELKRAEGQKIAALAEAAEKTKHAEDLASKLEGAVPKSVGELERRDGKLTLKLVNKLLFKTAKAELTDRGMALLKKVGLLLKEDQGKQIWVQGHTDRFTIANEEFGSNWELSAQRAINVVHFLQDDVEIDPRRLAAVAFGATRPISRSNHARNRRIEIVVFPKNSVKLATR